jgi:pyruvate/2-oxoglutarate/acetoin dehydrogenase E1 component
LRDPLEIHAPRLAPGERLAIEAEVNAQLAAAFEQALADPYPPCPPIFASPVYAQGENAWGENGGKKGGVLDSLNAALHQALAANERALLLGEDILDPYGGAFKVTRGLSTAYPDRVWATPISEAGMVGVAVGMALRGLRPVVEIMFGDFLTLAADQLINHAAKFRWMYGDGLPGHADVLVPLVVRTPMGGRRGYGPTHSQTLEKHFLGVPGLRVLAPASLGDPGALLRRTILETEDPVLFIENKLQYLLPVGAGLEDFVVHEADGSFTLALKESPAPRLTLAAYGYMSELARQAALQLAYEHEIFCELVVLTQLAPCEVEPVLASVRRTGRLLAVEEGAFSWGWAAEVVARAAEALGPSLRAARRLGAAEHPIPASGPLEAAALPGVEEIVQAAEGLQDHVQ